MTLKVPIRPPYKDGIVESKASPSATMGPSVAQAASSSTPTVSATTPRFSEKFDKLFISAGGNTVALPNTEGARANLLTLKTAGGIQFWTTRRSEPMTAGGDTPVIVYIKNGNLAIDAEVFAGEMEPPMHVRNNELSDRPARWDKNTDNEHALEIVNENTLPVLQIIYSDEARATIKGVFVNQKVAAIIDDEIRGVSKREVVRYPIKRLFKYPSWKYPGVFEE